MGEENPKEERRSGIVRLASGLIAILVADCTLLPPPMSTVSSKTAAHVRSLVIVVCPYNYHDFKMLEEDVKSDHPVITVWRITKNSRYCQPHARNPFERIDVAPTPQNLPELPQEPTMEEPPVHLGR